MDEGRLPPKGGGYRRLLSFRKAQIIDDSTVAFCRHYLSCDAHTIDQIGAGGSFRQAEYGGEEDAMFPEVERFLQSRRFTQDAISAK